MICVETNKNVSSMHVVCCLKKNYLYGLQLPPDFVPTNYFTSLNDAKIFVHNFVQENVISTVVNFAETADKILSVHT